MKYLLLICGMLIVPVTLLYAGSSLTFVDSGSQRLRIPASASTNSIKNKTVALWVVFNSSFTVTTPSVLWNKTPNTLVGGAVSRFHIVSSTGMLRVIAGQTTTAANYEVSSPTLTLNVPWFLAFTYRDSGASRVRIYASSGTNTVQEATYTAAATDGSGTIGVDSSSPTFVGATYTTGAQSTDMNVQWFAEWNRILTLAELQEQQFKPVINSTNVVIFMYPGANGTGTQYDLSGLANNGTVNGPTEGVVGSPFSISGESL